MPLWTAGPVASVPTPTHSQVSWFLRGPQHWHPFDAVPQIIGRWQSHWPMRLSRTSESDIKFQAPTRVDHLRFSEETDARWKTPLHRSQGACHHPDMRCFMGDGIAMASPPLLYAPRRPTEGSSGGSTTADRIQEWSLCYYGEWVYGMRVRKPKLFQTGTLLL